MRSVTEGLYLTIWEFRKRANLPILQSSEAEKAFSFRGSPLTKGYAPGPRWGEAPRPHYRLATTLAMILPPRLLNHGYDAEVSERKQRRKLLMSLTIRWPTIWQHWSQRNSKWRHCHLMYIAQMLYILNTQTQCRPITRNWSQATIQFSKGVAALVPCAPLDQPLGCCHVTVTYFSQ